MSSSSPRSPDPSRGAATPSASTPGGAPPRDDDATPVDAETRPAGGLAPSSPPLRRSPSLRERVRELGALRIALLALVAGLAASAPFASPEAEYTIGRIWPTLLAAPVALMMAFVVPLDLLMTRIYMADKEGAERGRYRRILAAEATAFALLVAAWVPFFAPLLER